MHHSVRAATRIAVLVALAAIITPAGAVVPNPTVTGPIPINAPPGDPSHDYPQLATQVDIASEGITHLQIKWSANKSACRQSSITRHEGLLSMCSAELPMECILHE